MFLKFRKVLSLLLIILISSCGKQTCRGISSEQMARFLIARKQYYSGDREEALILSGKIRQESPCFSENNSLYARILYYEGREEEAAVLWKEILDREEYHIDVIKQLSRYYIAGGRGPEAESLIMKGLSRSSEDPVLLFLLAESYLRQDNLSGALSLLYQADILMERQCEIYLKRASLFQEYGNYKEALAALNKARVLLNDGHPLVSAVEGLEKKLELEISIIKK